jgi:hypothetical protein
MKETNAEPYFVDFLRDAPEPTGTVVMSVIFIKFDTVSTRLSEPGPFCGYNIAIGTRQVQHWPEWQWKFSTQTIQNLASPDA